MKNILKWLGLIIALLILGSPASAQTGNTEHSVLWKISGNGLTDPSYLFGTIHIIGEKDYFFTGIMQQKFDSCKALAMEIDINIPLLKQVEIAQRTLLPKGRTLEDYLDEHNFTVVKSYMLDSLHIKKAKFRKYIKIKPFFLSSIIASASMGKTVTYEKEFNKRAKRNGMTTLGLETIEFQLSLVEKTSVEDQAKSLVEEIHDAKKNKAMLDSMTTAYKAQNIDELYRLISSDSTIDEGFMKDYLVDRNVKWLPEIENIARKQKTFFAVGAGHLGGEQGLLNLLRTKGYTVNAVK